MMVIRADYKKDKPEEKAVRRRCLKCREYFRSINNRVCKKCTKENENISVAILRKSKETLPGRYRRFGRER